MKKIKWIKSPVIYGYAYTRGSQCDLDNETAERLARKGVIQIMGESKKEVYQRPQTAELPPDVPYRDELLEAGIVIFEQLKEIKDYTKIKGIGPAKAKAIDNYFSKTIHTR